MLNIALPGVVIIYEELIEKADRIISSTENFLKKIEAYDKLKALKIEERVLIVFRLIQGEKRNVMLLSYS
jgi:hypothetical protein